MAISSAMLASFSLCDSCLDWAVWNWFMNEKQIAFGYEVEIREDRIWIHQEGDGVVFSEHQISELIACLAAAATKIQKRKAAHE